MSSDESPPRRKTIGDGDEAEAEEQEEEDEDDYFLFARRRGCCWSSCFGGGEMSSRSPICFRRMRSISSESSRPWWRKLREWSELVAGPRWKTFIRRFNRRSKSSAGRFRYDELSYSLNFDAKRDGDFDDDDDDDDLLGRDFSSRFASVPVDLGSGVGGTALAT